MSTLNISRYLGSSYAFLVVEHDGTRETIRAAAGAVEVYRSGEITTVGALHDTIVDGVVAEIHRFACVTEAAEAEAARRVFRLADQLDETAARALLTVADLLNADLAEIEAGAAEAWREAAEALYGPDWG